MGYIRGFFSLLIVFSFTNAVSPMAPVEFKPFDLEFTNSYGISPRLLKALAFVESSLDHTKISTTLDYGIGQINYKTAEAYNIDLQRLVTDRAYSIDRAAFVLSTFQKQFKSKEPETWYCRFNVGTAVPLPENLKYQCEVYVARIRAAMGEQ